MSEHEDTVHDGTIMRRCPTGSSCSIMSMATTEDTDIAKKAHLIRIFNIVVYIFGETLYINYNVAATFVLNEYIAIFQKYVRDLTKRCCNVVKTLDMIHFQY